MKRPEMPLNPEADKAVGPQGHFNPLGGSLAPKDPGHGLVHNFDLPFVQPPFHVGPLLGQSACQSIDQACQIRNMQSTAFDTIRPCGLP